MYFVLNISTYQHNSLNMDQISNIQESTYEFIGSHYFASFVDCNHEKIIDIGELKKILFTAIIPPKI